MQCVTKIVSGHYSFDNKIFLPNVVFRYQSILSLQFEVLWIESPYSFNLNSYTKTLDSVNLLVLIHIQIALFVFEWTIYFRLNIFQSVNELMCLRQITLNCDKSQNLIKQDLMIFFLLSSIIYTLAVLFKVRGGD